ncbi:MAG TPA: hypothetical protein VGM28_07285 [Candidatus Limnocylindrales bacterium]|jgi:hypothetical protein
MDQLRTFELQYRIEHRHPDGSWAEMVEERPHNDPAEHDAERAWGKRRLFRCGKCNETVTIEPGDEGDQPQ